MTTDVGGFIASDYVPAHTSTPHSKTPTRLALQRETDKDAPRWRDRTTSHSTSTRSTRVLATLDIDKIWKAATEVEQRVLIEEFLEEILVSPEYLDVKVFGSTVAGY